MAYAPYRAQPPNRCSDRQPRSLVRWLRAAITRRPGLAKPIRFLTGTVPPDYVPADWRARLPNPADRTESGLAHD
ncbi:hypothetical protein EHYA_10153 [Embleya hyalina]|uniref:Uncharacterized protein n=1 Tax=Embleya hyalina TaxID=516124 RepID=A0A401Z6C5_9ACTN|nr:hypothetical protein EHYA_10153 [Embleya hyalina]